MVESKLKLVHEDLKDTAIIKNLDRAVKIVTEKYGRENIVCVYLAGSWLYGTMTKDSDYDFLFVMLPKISSYLDMSFGMKPISEEIIDDGLDIKMSKKMANSRGVKK